MCRSTLALVTLVALAGSGFGDTLELTDGSLVEGRFLGGTQQTVRFQVGEEVVTYPVGDVLALTFTGAPPAPETAPAEVEQVPQAEAEPVPAEPSPPAVSIPAGTRILFRAQEPLDSRRHKTGHMFTAALETDLTVGNQVVAPKGSLLYGRLVSARRAGRLAGRSELTIQMTDLMIDGRPHDIEATGVRAVSESTTGDTARKVGTGAAIGGLANGSKGARTGAKVGAGLAILTSGRQVVIPPNTLLEIQLTQPLRHQP